MLSLEAPQCSSQSPRQRKSQVRTHKGLHLLWATYVHTSLCTHTHTYTPTNKHKHAHTHKTKPIHKHNMHTCGHTCINIHILTCTYIHTQYRHMYTCINTHTYVHAHMNRCLPPQLPGATLGTSYQDLAVQGTNTLLMCSWANRTPQPPLCPELGDSGLSDCSP